MAKVKLRDGIRVYSVEDSDFTIDKGQEKELFERFLKSYPIKHALFKGDFRLTEGELIINVKHAKVLFSAKHPELCYGFEFGKFFEKDMVIDTIVWKPFDELPAGVYEKLTGFGIKVEAPKVEEKKVEAPKVEEKKVNSGLSEEELEKMKASLKGKKTKK